MSKEPSAILLVIKSDWFKRAAVKNFLLVVSLIVVGFFVSAFHLSIKWLGIEGLEMYTKALVLLFKLLPLAAILFFIAQVIYKCFYQWLSMKYAEPDPQVELQNSEGDTEGTHSDGKDAGEVRIRVVTTCLDTGEVNERVIDHNDREQRQWLGRHCHWAFRNNRSVKTIPV